MKENFMQGRLLSSKFVGILSISLSIALFGVAAFGQQPDRGFQSANAYAASGLEAINTTNGNLVMNIPIAKLPAGRGGNPGYTVTLQYNSKLWESKDTTRNDGSPDEYGNTHYTSTALGLSPQGGWRLQTAFSLDVTNRLSFEAPNPCYMGDPVENLSFIWKVQMLMPDGSVKQFFPETGRDQFTGMGKDGYANIDINGTKYNASTVTVPACAVQQSTTQISTSGMNYITLDGSRIRLYVPYHASNIAANSRNWKMYFPDGTIVENLPPDEPTVAQRITDRNGNSVKHIGGKIIDDLGRYIEFLTDSETGDQIVRVKGVGGENVDTKIRWTDKWINRMYRKTNATNAPTNERYGTAFTSIAVVSKITLPAQVGQQSMDFEYFADNTQPSSGVYTNGWGELKKVTVPTGATSEYQYLDDGNGSIETTPAEVLDRHATRKDLKYDEQYDGAAPVQRTDTWLYEVSRWASSVTNPNGSVSNEYQNYFSNSTGFWENGLAYRSVSPDGSFTERLWAHNLPFSMTNALPSVPGAFEAVGNANAYATAEMTTITDLTGNPTLTAIKEYKYDKNGNALEIKEYDWVPYGSVPRSGSGIFSKVTGLPPTNVLVLKRKTVNTYYNQAADAQVATANSNSYSDPASPKLKNVIKSTEIQNENGSPVSRSEFFYDDPDNKGNLTETRTWDSTKSGYSNPLNAGNSVSTTIQYDSYGNAILSTDPKGNQTLITYGPVNGFSGLYPTETKSAYNTAIQQTVQAEYDFNTGLTTRTTALGNTAAENIVSETEYDAVGRPVKVKTAVGTPLEIWSTTEYNDALRRVIVRSDIETKGDGKKIGVQHFDQLGRVRLTRQLENVLSEDPTNETHGIKVQTRYQTGNPYSYQMSSNPYRAATSGAATAEESMGWTRSKAWNTGKRSETETFSGAALPAPWGNNAATSGIVRTDADANRTLVTDQAGKQRMSKTNGLGQLTDVWEILPAADASTVSVTFPGHSISYGYQTSYQYDTLGNLITVSQGVQTRTFAYSSLSRLLNAVNPESGTIQYAYDPNGNLTTRTDARGVVTTYAYDALNRATQRSYSTPNGTPANYQVTPNVTYTYDDLAIANSKGRLTKVAAVLGANVNSETRFQAFDILGRVVQSQQWVDGVSYGDPMTYTYNLSGALIEQTYPSGRVVKNVLDNDGDLSIVRSKKNTVSGYWDYAKGFTYTAAGAVGSMQLGNGRWESTVFNSRLQPTQIALGTVQNGTDKLKLNFDYGTTANNGNVLSQTITVPTETINSQTYGAFMAVQTYTYDSLNRIKDAKEMIGEAQEWKQTFDYDRYGNRRFDTANNNTTTLAPGCPTAVCNPTIDPATNKLIGYSFDNAGNTKLDAENREFIYDGENKQVEVKDQNGATVGKYAYNGDGQRVRKLTATESTVFVYNASGQLVAEYATQIAQTAEAKVSYLTNDHLGSPRITTDANGQVISRRDFQPFGEEIARAGYGTDAVRQKFTTYERDEETQLDFAQARMYQRDLGRFTTVDPLLTTGRIPAPQTWNRFSYVLNNPLAFVDPLGLYECKAGETDCGKISQALENAKKVRDTYGNDPKYGKESKEFKALDRAINAYGCDASKCGDEGKNGVKVYVADLSKRDSNGVTAVSGVLVDGKQDINVAIDSGILDRSDLLTSTVAHEGAHVAEGAEWVACDFCDSQNLSRYDDEHAAYNVSGYVFQVLRPNGEGTAYRGLTTTKLSKGKSLTGLYRYTTWSSSWQDIDKERLRNINDLMSAQGETKDKKSFVKGSIAPSDFKKFVENP